MTIQSKDFREDINGLRAWAVASVILYHFGIPGFSGGFVGVDIFFVISGFLMTGILVKALEKPPHGVGGSSAILLLVRFYLARAKRIIPALIALCIVLMIVGWFILSAPEYKTLGAHAISALGFFSNMKFWNEAGYFDAASHEKLLLHTWSLSVEWQFYVILPLVLLATWKIRPGRLPLTIVVAIGLLLSLVLSIVLSPIKPTAAFYLLPTRAWEMLAGGLVCLLANPIGRLAGAQKALEASGFALIIASIALFDTTSNWPGWRAAVPVIGTMLVLMAARQGSLWSGSRIAQWLGSCSYSLYLWHWPLVVALVYLQKQDQAGAIAAGLAMTIVFGWFSYRWVESPARISLTRMPQWAGAGALLAAVALVTVPSLLVQMEHGVPGRLPAQIDAIFNAAENRNPRRQECDAAGHTPFTECTYGGRDLGVIVMGDSHAGALVLSVEKALPSKNLHTLEWTMNGCPTISGIKKFLAVNFPCDEFIHHAFTQNKSLHGNAPLIIINRTSAYIMGEPGRANLSPAPPFYIDSPHMSRSAEYFHEMREGIIKTACEFSKTRQVYMVRPIPEFSFDVPKTMGRALMRGQQLDVSISQAEYEKRNQFVWETQDIASARCGVKILDPLPYLCTGGRCKGEVDGMPIYYDKDHLNERGRSLLVPMFRQIFENSVQSDMAIAKRELPEVNAELAAGIAGTHQKRGPNDGQGLVHP